MAEKKKPVFYLGEEKPWEQVNEFYLMMLDAYNNYVADDEKMTPARSLYILGFKHRVDAAAKVLGIETEVELPKNINKKQKENTDEQQ